MDEYWLSWRLRWAMWRLKRRSCLRTRQGRRQYVRRCAKLARKYLPEVVYYYAG